MKRVIINLLMKEVDIDNEVCPKKFIDMEIENFFNY